MLALNFGVSFSNLLSIFTILPNIVLLIIYLASKNKSKVGRIVIPIIYASIASDAFLSLVSSTFLPAMKIALVSNLAFITVFVAFSLCVSYIMGMITSITGKNNKAILIVALISAAMFDTYSLMNIYTLFEYSYYGFEETFILVQIFVALSNLFIHIMLFIIGLKAQPVAPAQPVNAQYNAPPATYAPNYAQQNQPTNTYTTYFQPNAYTPSAQPQNTPAEMLKILNTKRELGIITQEEYNQISAEIIKNL